MLEDHLPLLPVKRGRPLSSPRNHSTLDKHYLVAATIEAYPDEVKNLKKDTGVVLTLRPNYLDTTTLKRNDKHNTVKGCFAWGQEIDDYVRFEIYTSRRSAMRQSTNRDLEIITGLFAIRLVQEGYSIEVTSSSNPITFWQYLNTD